jgi:hypothetical protein
LTTIAGDARHHVGTLHELERRAEVGAGLLAFGILTEYDGELVDGFAHGFRIQSIPQPLHLVPRNTQERTCFAKRVVTGPLPEFRRIPREKKRFDFGELFASHGFPVAQLQCTSTQTALYGLPSAALFCSSGSSPGPSARSVVKSPGSKGRLHARQGIPTDG